MRAAHFREHPLIAFERCSQQSRELTFALHKSREDSDRRGAAERREIVAAHVVLWNSSSAAIAAASSPILAGRVACCKSWDDSERLDFVKWEAQPTTGLLAGLAPTLEGSSPAGPSPFSVIGKVAA